MSKRKTYTDEFKTMIAELVLSGKAVKDVASEYILHTNYDSFSSTAMYTSIYGISFMTYSFSKHEIIFLSSL